MPQFIAQNYVFGNKKIPAAGKKSENNTCNAQKKRVLSGRSGYTGVWLQARSNRHQNTIYLYQSGAADERSKQSSGRY
ncbi:MAG: hypothetical protein BHW56_07270 [Acetobacter sp. 46_36]|nr:MAG: hypothetical protein BHW56_07270 [Acetobacter sp. 46_36]